MEAIEIKSLMELADRARQVQDAYLTVDPTRTTFLARLSNLRELAEQFAISTAELVRQEADLAARFRESMESILETPSGRSYARPIAAPAPLDPAQQAAEVVADLQARGIEIVAYPDASLSVAPASKLRQGEGTVIRTFHMQIVEVLRRDVLLLPPVIPARPRPAAQS